MALPRRLPGRSLGGAALAILLTTGAAAQEVPSEGIHFDLQTRERIEAVDRVALDASDDHGLVTAYHRLLAGIAARSGAVSGYLQLGLHERTGGRGPAPPTSRDGLDVQQAYLDLSIGSPGRGVRLRAGRSEMAFELIASRDAPNVRRAWDGVRSTATLGGFVLDAFDVRLIEPRLGTLDDSSAQGDRLWGAHLTGGQGASAPLGVSAFAYRVDQRAFSLLAGTSRTRTTTLGAVLNGRAGRLDLSGGGAVQTGRFGTRPINAFYLEGEAIYRLDGVQRPSVGLRASLFSGGSPDADTIRTFDPLFPNYAYSTEAALQSPSNLIKVAALAELKPSPALTLQYRGEALWRYSSADAYYVPTGFKLIFSPAERSRWSGFQQQLRASWVVNEVTTLTGAFVRFDASPALRRQGRGNEDFLLVQLAFTWR